jgi:hypothetical protein
VPPLELWVGKYRIVGSLPHEKLLLEMFGKREPETEATPPLQVKVFSIIDFGGEATDRGWYP